jgi:predicted nucleotidyltransferase
MGRSYFLDRDLLVSKDDSIYVVIGNAHPMGYALAYLKYVRGRGPWRGYKRTLRKYGVRNLLSSPQRMEFEPCYDVSFPFLPVSQVKRHLLPEEGLEELLRKPAGPQGEALMTLVSTLGAMGLGVTGSMLSGTFHSRSDVDLLVYGCRRSMEVFKGFQEDLSWVEKASRTYGLSIEEARSLYDVRRRGRIGGVGYSVNFVDDRPKRYCFKVCRRVGEQEIWATLRGNCEALFYPAEVNMEQAEVVRGPSLIPTKVISYESVYSPLLFIEEKLRIRGMLMDCEGELQLLVGDREVPGYVKKM